MSGRITPARIGEATVAIFVLALIGWPDLTGCETPRRPPPPTRHCVEERSTPSVMFLPNGEGGFTSIPTVEHRCVRWNDDTVVLQPADQRTAVTDRDR